MKMFSEMLNDELKSVFRQCGIEEKDVRATVSNRPDLCEYQCNACLAAAKKNRENPMDLAGKVAELLKNSSVFEKADAVKPGFLNLDINRGFLADYIRLMAGNQDKNFGTPPDSKKKTIIVDYGGANVAKPLHIGHLRSAVIGESIKRMGAYFGNRMIGDVHLGDWGLQMGLIIEELRTRKPDLVYFDDSFTGEYPKEAPFSISELEEIYPAASQRSKTDEEFKKRAQEATLRLQSGYAPFRAIWNHIMNVSLADLKKNYDDLNVSFELWKGESDAQKDIPGLVDDLVKRGLAHESEGALVVDVRQEGDKKELPPCIIRKSDGAALYATSDLATLVQREREYDPDMIIYVTDKRQDMHFLQVFRVAKKAGICPDVKLVHIGYGTMNGKDQKPFKTREGGVMRLENLIDDVRNAVKKKIIENKQISPEEADSTAKLVGLAAVKYADLSNQASKDYIFDIDRFTSFEGNTGPYILYTIVRIGSILEKSGKSGTPEPVPSDIAEADSDILKDLCLKISEFGDMVTSAWQELTPHRICQYIYSVADTFNSFYHDIKILSENDEKKRRSYLAIIKMTKEVLTDCVSILGIEVPKRM